MATPEKIDRAIDAVRAVADNYVINNSLSGGCDRVEVLDCNQIARIVTLLIQKGNLEKAEKKIRETIKERQGLCDECPVLSIADRLNI